MTNKRADLYCGIASAIEELSRIRSHLMRFGLTEEQQLEGVEDAIKNVSEYLSDPEKMYRFEDLCTPPIISGSKED